jgi:hypothetical protein
MEIHVTINMSTNTSEVQILSDIITEKFDIPYSLSMYKCIQWFLNILQTRTEDTVTPYIFFSTHNHSTSVSSFYNRNVALNKFWRNNIIKYFTPGFISQSTCTEVVIYKNSLKTTGTL